MKLWLLPGAFLLGLVIAVQLTMNAACASGTGNLRATNLIFWCVGAVTAITLGVSAWGHGFGAIAVALPKWWWLAGALGACIVVGITILINHLGAGTTNVLMLAGQVIGGCLIAHYGLLGSPQVPLTGARVLGLAVMLAGATVAVTGKLGVR